MFLALTPVVAAGRALFAFAVVALSVSGHAVIGHVHVDMSRLGMAFLLLLAVSWRTHDARALLLASIAAQCLVHGGIPMASPTMFALHAIGALAAFILVSRFERVWAGCAAALRPLLRPVAWLRLPHLPRPVQAHRTVWHNPFHAHQSTRISPRRGPPFFAWS